MAEELRELRQLSIRASDEIRKAIFALTSPRRDGSGLTDELRSMLSEFERDTGIHAHLSVSGSASKDIEQVDDVVRVVVEEILTNVKKHADARMVLVSLRYEPQKLDLVIQDDGEGAPEALLRSFQDSYLHFGLRHIRQLVIDRGGEFVVTNGEEARSRRKGHPATRGRRRMIRIAIVDDHEIVREGLKSILQCEPDFEVVAESRDRGGTRRARGERQTSTSSCSMHGFPVSAGLKLVAGSLQPIPR